MFGWGCVKSNLMTKKHDMGSRRVRLDARSLENDCIVRVARQTSIMDCKLLKDYFLNTCRNFCDVSDNFILLTTGLRVIFRNREQLNLDGGGEETFYYIYTGLIVRQVGRFYLQ